MKVVLLDNVKKVGRKYDVVEVSTGYGLNFLLPKKLAIQATPAEISKYSYLKAEQIKTDSEHLNKIKEALKAIGGEVEVAGKVNEQGHLFAGITAEDIAAKLKEVGVTVATHDLDVKHHLKEVGPHEVTIHLHGEDLKVKVVVIAE